MLGTSWGQEGAKLVPAPGDPWYSTYTYDPMKAPFSPPPVAVADIPQLEVPGMAPVTMQAGSVAQVPLDAVTTHSDPAAIPGPGSGFATSPGPGNAPVPDGGGN